MFDLGKLNCDFKILFFCQIFQKHSFYLIIFFFSVNTSIEKKKKKIPFTNIPEHKTCHMCSRKEKGWNLPSSFQITLLQKI